jgi:hypothetical protein
VRHPLRSINVIASEVKQSSFLCAAAWIASSQALLAMTLMDGAVARIERLRNAPAIPPKIPVVGHGHEHLQIA